MPDEVLSENQDVGSSLYVDEVDGVAQYESSPNHLKELQRHVRSLYESGKPLFTRETIRAAMACRDRCLRDPSKVQEFDMMGYDDKPVKVLVLLEGIFPESKDEGIVPMNVGPVIDYASIESMLSQRHGLYETITLPMRICTAMAHYKLHENDEALMQSPDALTSHFIKVQHEWQATEHYASFRQALLSAKFALRINKIIGYALGPCFISGKFPNQVSLLQHAFMLLLRDILSLDDGRGEVKCFLQDPAYGLEDKRTHAAMGMSVVDDPEGFLLVDDESVVVSIAPNVPVKQIVLDLCRPAGIIWMRDNPQSENTEERREGMTDPESTRVQALIRHHYDVIRLPDGEAAVELCLYIRKS